jgi:phosphatidylglycerophosphate synthase
MINLDKKYTEYILNKTDIFQYIHPNAVSVLGLFTDFFILYFISSHNIVLAGIAIFIRYSCDTLDGGIARKYKKVSDLGGALDTIADNTLIFVLSYSILKLYGSNYSLLVSIIIVAANLLYMYRKKALLHHEHLHDSRSLCAKIYTFGMNNTCILYAFIYLWIVALICF